MSIKATLSAFQNKFVRPVATKVQQHVKRNEDTYNGFRSLAVMISSGFVLGYQVQNDCSPGKGESLFSFKARQAVGFGAGFALGFVHPREAFRQYRSFAKGVVHTVAAHVVARQYFNGNLGAALQPVDRIVVSALNQVYDPQTKTFKPRSQEQQ